MVKHGLILLLLTTATVWATAQEMLVPAGHAFAQPMAAKSATAVGLPFFDDFSDYSGAANPTLWDRSSATVDNGFAPLPPTIGVLTLDAYDADGSLYDQATTSLFPADTATSLPIRLDTVGAADSVVFSFYYLPGGGSGNMWERVGDSPDAHDSLVLEFYGGGQWQTVWSRGGVSVDTLLARTGHAWQYVAIPIADDLYFDSTFRFRFRNYCSLESDGKAGRTVGGDQWSIDYVLLDRGRDTSLGPVSHDIAFVDPAPTMLRHYQAMPARQFRPSDMAQKINMRIGNLYSSTLATHYGYSVLDGDGNTLYTYDGGYENAPAGSYQTSPVHTNPTVGYTFEQSATPHTYTVVHTVREGAAGDDHQANDTTRFVQVFDNYYAYDDGVAENGYGITSTASRISLAYRFDLNVADTLTAVDMYFNQTYQRQNEAVQFYITIWQADASGRPSTVLYRDSSRRLPATGRWNRYLLEQGVVVDGSILVGFEQVGNTFINIGFDRSMNSSERIWHLASPEWKQSILSGSLLLRPCFGQRATVGIPPVAAMHPCANPNPASGTVLLTGVPEGSTVLVYSMQGRLMATSRRGRIDVEPLPNGVYILRTMTPDGIGATTKLIVQH